MTTPRHCSEMSVSRSCHQLSRRGHLCAAVALLKHWLIGISRIPPDSAPSPVQTRSLNGLMRGRVTMSSIAELMGNSPAIVRRHHAAWFPEAHPEAVEFDHPSGPGPMENNREASSTGPKCREPFIVAFLPVFNRGSKDRHRRPYILPHLLVEPVRFQRFLGGPLRHDYRAA